MRLRSTGLGNTELEAKIVSVRRVDDLVIFFVNITKPVKWKTRMGFQRKDLKELVLSVLRPRNMLAVLKSLLFSHKQVPKVKDF